MPKTIVFKFVFEKTMQTLANYNANQTEIGVLIAQ